MKRKYVIKGNCELKEGEKEEKIERMMYEELINYGWDIVSVEILREKGAI